jgi:endothelin-converting enzyme/putative endopeptidase
MASRISLLMFAAMVASTLLAADTPYKTLPYTPSLDVTSMDRTADPCQDLYQYSCGGWMKNNPIPADQASWSVYGKLYQDNQRYLWGILSDLAKPSSKRNANQQKIGDYFATCMNVGAIEKAGLRPLKEDLQRIAKMKSIADFGAVLGTLHASGSEGLFGVSVQQDAKESEKEILAIAAGGIGLPDRDYYLKTDDKSKEIRAKYLDHVAKMFVLLGDNAKQAKSNADLVMRLETNLATASLSRVDLRDPYKVYHRTEPAKLPELVAQLNWDAYFAALGAKPTPWLNVTEPEFFKAASETLKTESLATIQTYLRWFLVNENANYLPKRFVDEHFAFYSSTLRGVKEQPPRWKKCVAWIDRDLGEALGKEFIDRAFTPQMKSKTTDMTKLIVDAMGQRIAKLDWMQDTTKSEALKKLALVKYKVGYPEKWRDYSALSISPNDFFGNAKRATIFETKRQLAKIGKPVDHSEWQMSPPTVNAYYDSSLNDMNFPAGVLMPPLYDFKLDDAPNYGNTGGTIGHELTHGFDDEGRQYDGNGNLRDWWTKKDGEEFESRANCVRNQYGQYVVVDDIKINSKLTSGEDIADLGGAIIAWMAWKEATKDMKLASLDGLTPEQRFFVGLAQWACENQRPENLRVKAATDPHSPAKYRINGVVTNMPEFAEAFQCKDGSALKKKPQDICRIW